MTELAWRLASDLRCSARPLGALPTSTNRKSAGSRDRFTSPSVSSRRIAKVMLGPQCRRLCKCRDRRHTQKKRLYPSADSGTIAQMDARSEPGLNDPFEEAIDDALSSLPADLRAAMSNVEIVVEDEPPDGQPLLGLYRGVPLPRRSSTFSGVLPDKISIFGGPITRLAAGDADRLRREVRHVVLHEIAHHFGISDERLIELDRY